MKAIDIQNEIERFKTHLKQNQRIIFSAKFGDGKTYFLKEAKKILSKDYYFITIYPINYSVAPNEDIFEYIKRDILIQLANDNKLEYNRINLDALGKSIFNLESLKQVATVILEAAEISSTRFNKATKFLKTVKDHYQENKKLFSDYEITFKSLRGGIYEEDAFTGFIKQALETIQGKVDISSGERKCVLIIEDLDRIDPGHLFRILNVFGAQIDFDVVKNNEGHNKFGFDNIVVVMDYEITRHIFYHFYGANANYEGYMSKFFSHYPFSYSVTKAAQDHLKNKIIFKYCKVDSEELIRIRYGKSQEETIHNLIEKTSLRDIIRVIDNYRKQIVKEDIIINNYKISSVNSLTILLSIIFLLKPNLNVDELISSILETNEPLNIVGPLLIKYEPVFLERKQIIYKEKSWLLKYSVDNKTKKMTKCNFISEIIDADNNNCIEENLNFAIKVAFKKAVEYVKDLSKSMEVNVQ